MVEISEIKFILNVLALSVIFCITLIIGFLLFRLLINLLEKVYIKLSIKMLEVKKRRSL